MSTTRQHRRGMLAAGIALAAALLIAAPTATAAPTTTATFDLPAPTGQHEVGVTELHLVDEHRADPWKPDRMRELMVSIWYPAHDTDNHPIAPYVSEGLAAMLMPQDVDWVGARSHGHQGAPVDHGGGDLPVVLYSPGSAGLRATATTVVENLASRGYVVVTIDHTFETPVEFPGDRVEPQLETVFEQPKRAIDTRVADTRFVLDEITLLDTGVNPDAEDRPLPPACSARWT